MGTGIHQTPGGLGEAQIKAGLHSYREIIHGEQLRGLCRISCLHPLAFEHVEGVIEVHLAISRDNTRAWQHRNSGVVGALIVGVVRLFKHADNDGNVALICQLGHGFHEGAVHSLGVFKHPVTELAAQHRRVLWQNNESSIVVRRSVYESLNGAHVLCWVGPRTELRNSNFHAAHILGFSEVVVFGVEFFSHYLPNPRISLVTRTSLCICSMSGSMPVKATIPRMWAANSIMTW